MYSYIRFCVSVGLFCIYAELFPPEIDKWNHGQGIGKRRSKLTLLWKNFHDSTNMQMLQPVTVHHHIHIQQLLHYEMLIKTVLRVRMSVCSISHPCTWVKLYRHQPFGILRRYFLEYCHRLGFLELIIFLMGQC